MQRFRPTTPESGSLASKMSKKELDEAINEQIGLDKNGNPKGKTSAGTDLDVLGLGFLTALDD